MTACKIKFLPHNKEITVDLNKNLIHAAMEAGVHINASCGGEGVCGKCRVMIEEGEVEGGITEKLSKEDFDKGYRLACRSKVKSDLVVRVPVESDIDTGVLNLAVMPRRTARIRQMDFNELKEQGLFVPPVEKKYLELPKPDAQDHLPDVMRLVSYLKLQHGEHRISVELPVIRKIPDMLRENDFKITATLMRPVHEGRKTHIVNVQGGDATDRNYAMAIDIGTTTVYGQLIDLISGEVLAERGEFNSQISYGEDVITRMMYADKPGGLEKLHQLVVENINKIIASTIKKAGVDIEEISTITLAGNTTMTQLFLKVNPKYIRLSPYVPASTLYPPIKAVDLGIALGEHVPALVYPQVSSYVGGDIVAGVMGAGVYRSEEIILFIDIGTNAEVVVGNKDWLACAAASAGPALEGGGITFGMRAAKGAIEDFSIDPVTLEPMNITIGQKRAKGICGSGLINIVAVFVEHGIVDNAGKFDRDLKTPRLRNQDDIWEYVLVWANETQIDRDIVITEIDIENLIRAKGAMYSGYMTLLSEVGMSIRDVDRVILSGGFGSSVDLEKAMTIGLLPEIDAEKVTFIGNGSLMGAKMSSLTNRIRRDVVNVTKMMTNFELSETPSYMDHYMAALFLPHTDIDLFPKVRDRMKERRKLKKLNQT